MSKKGKGKKTIGTIVESENVTEEIGNLIIQPGSSGSLKPLKTPEEIEELIANKGANPEPLDRDTIQIVGFINAINKTLKALRQHKPRLKGKEKKGIDVVIKHLVETKKLGLSVPYQQANWYSDRVFMCWGLDQQYPTLEEQKGKFKVSGHLTDQKLKYTYPKDSSAQLSIWDSLKDSTKNQVNKAQVEVTELVEGIKLSPSEQKVIDSLCKLLHERSQTVKPQKEDYYTGNAGYSLVEYGGEKGTPAPQLAFTLYELTQEYKGGEAIGGKDVENVKNILHELDNRRFLLSYVETTPRQGGGRIERKIEDFRKLVHILKISETEFSKEDVELSKKEETVILLNPIFRRQINSKFILYPNDINRRTIIAYGSHNLSEITLRLRDYLMRELSSKRYSPEITMDRLYWMLSEKWMKESRKKKVKDYTDKALETCKALGLLESYKVKTSSKGEPKIIFKLNEDWE